MIIVLYLNNIYLWNAIWNDSVNNKLVTQEMGKIWNKFTKRPICAPNKTPVFCPKNEKTGLYSERTILGVNNGIKLIVINDSIQVWLINIGDGCCLKWYCKLFIFWFCDLGVFSGFWGRRLLGFLKWNLI